MRPRNFKDVFSAPELTLGMIEKETGLIAARAALSILLSDVVSFFNVGKTMDDRQVAITCDLIIEDFPYLKLEDFKLCFKKGMKRSYDKMYDRLDGGVILGWLKEYICERDEEASLIQITESKESVQNEGVFLQDYLINLKKRADEGDEKAKECLKVHLEHQSLLRRVEPEYRTYIRYRERKRLYGK